MSTGSDLSEYYENGPLGHRYVIHLKSKDEICLHALTLLQTDLLPCFIPVFFSEDEDDLLIDLKGCIPLSSLKGKERFYVRKHYKELISSFLRSLIQSLDHALDPHGICYLENQLFYDRIKQRLVCIYLPVSSRMKGEPLLSSIDENGLDELLHEPYEKKWISEKAMEMLYAYFRKDDEASALRYIDNTLWEESHTLPSRLRYLCIFWGLLVFSYILFSPKLKHKLRGTSYASLPGMLIVFLSITILVILLVYMKKTSHERKELSEEKDRRRKRKNAQMLFPTSDSTSTYQDDPLELHAEPVQLIRIDHKNTDSRDKDRVTIWTNACTVGSDSDCCDIPIDHPSIALCHARFAHNEFGFYIESLQDSKPTFRNRQRIRSNMMTYLEEGDIVGLGDLEYKTHFIHGNTKNQL